MDMFLALIMIHKNIRLRLTKWIGSLISKTKAVLKACTKIPKVLVFHTLGSLQNLKRVLQMDLKFDISIEKIKVFSTDYFQLHFILSLGESWISRTNPLESPLSRFLDLQLQMCKWLFKSIHVSTHHYAYLMTIFYALWKMSREEEAKLTDKKEETLG